jgi:hypothetical protein
MVLGFACKSSDGGDGGPAFLTVLQVSPVDGRMDAQVATRIGFQIDTFIEDETLNFDTFVVTDPDGNQVLGELVVDEEDARTAVLTPSEPLSVITSYTATITTELMDTAGNTLEEPFSWTFMTIDSEWGTDEWLESSGIGRSFAHEIVVDDQSNALAVWEFKPEATGTESGIWAKRYTRVDLWGNPEQIDAGDGGSEDPDLAADPEGNAFAVWEEVDEVGERTIWSNRYTVDEGWGTAESLQGFQINARGVSVAADEDGNAAAVWLEADALGGPSFFVWAARYEPGSGWSVQEQIDGDPTTSTLGQETDIEFDADGNAIAIWNQRTVPEGNVGRGEIIWVNRYVAGVGWQTPRMIKPDGNTRARSWRLSVGDNGEAHVVWVQNVETDVEERHDIWSAHYTPGSNWETTDWTEPQRLDDYDGSDDCAMNNVDCAVDGNKESPDVAIDGNGVAHAVWSQAEQKIPQADFANVYATRFTIGSGWSTPILIEPANSDPRDDGDATQPRVETNSIGNTFVVWRRIWNGRGSIWSNRIDPEQEWDPARTELIEQSDSGSGDTPKLAVDENRHAHAAWLQSVEVEIDRVRTNRFE